MAEEGLLYGDRKWFHDPRSPTRRMGVASHPDQGLMVLSLWTGETCTATFRLPMAETAQLISTLADGLTDGLASSSSALVTAPAVPRAGWRGLLDRVLHRSSGPRPAPLADVVPLRSVK